MADRKIAEVVGLLWYHIKYGENPHFTYLPSLQRVPRSIEVARVFDAVHRFASATGALRMYVDQSEGIWSYFESVETQSAVDVVELADEAAVVAYCQDLFANGRFDRPPLFKFSLITAESQTYLFSSFHHAICDGWSFSSYGRFLRAALAGRSYGPLGGSFSKLLQLVEGENSEPFVHYWTKRLTDVGRLPELLPLVHRDALREGPEAVFASKELISMTLYRKSLSLLSGTAVKHDRLLLALVLVAIQEGMGGVALPFLTINSFRDQLGDASARTCFGMASCSVPVVIAPRNEAFQDAALNAVATMSDADKVAISSVCVYRNGGYYESAYFPLPTVAVVFEGLGLSTMMIPGGTEVPLGKTEHSNKRSTIRLAVAVSIDVDMNVRVRLRYQPLFIDSALVTNIINCLKKTLEFSERAELEAAHS